MYIFVPICTEVITTFEPSVFSDESAAAYPAYPSPVYDQGNFDYSSYNEVNTDFSSHSGLDPVDRQDIVTAIGDVSYFFSKQDWNHSEASR